MLSNIFFGIALGSVVWGVVSAIVIASYCAGKGIKINLLFFRIMILKYIHNYYEITSKENGKPGFWFYSYIGAMNIALVATIIGMILR